MPNLGIFDLSVPSYEFQDFYAPLGITESVGNSLVHYFGSLAMPEVVKIPLGGSGSRSLSTFRHSYIQSQAG